MLKEHAVCPILSNSLKDISIHIYVDDVGHLGSRKVKTEYVSPVIFEKINRRHEIPFYHS